MTDQSDADHIPWWAVAAVYQVYVRSFADSDGDGIGDLEGIRSRLPYIAALGVDAIWLNPCYPSPQRDGGYDVSDYLDIDPEYGTMSTFDDLVTHAGQYGIRVLMDIVPNHCSDQHPWFREALAAGPGSAARDRFWFRDGRGPDGAQPPNDWTAIFGGPAWTRVTEPDGRPGQWYLGVFTSHQPDFNWHNSSVAEHFDQVLRFWFDHGAGGFRADAVTHIGKEPTLPDYGQAVPFGRANRHFDHHADALRVPRRWRSLIDEYNAEHPGRDVFVIAEAWAPPGTGLTSSYVGDDAFHQAFAFDLMVSAWRADAWRDTVQQVITSFAATGSLPAWALSNHDIERAATRLGRADAAEPRDPEGSHLDGSKATVDEVVGRRRAAAGALCMLALPGASYLYAGEELGLPEYLTLPDEDRRDPVLERSGGRVKGRDGCRIPLPWTVSPRGAHGFSSGGQAAAAPWLPQPADWGRHSAEALEGDPSSVLQMYRSALAARQKLRDLRSAPLRWVEVGPDVLAFTRGDVLVVLNMGRRLVVLEQDLLDDRRLVVSSDMPHGRSVRTEVAPDTCVWLSR